MSDSLAPDTRERKRPEELGFLPFRHCQWCDGLVSYVAALRDHGVHYADAWCVNCGRHIGYPAKPGAEKTKRSAPARKAVLKHSRGYCEMCCLREERLPPGEALEAHHVIPYSEDEAKQLGFAEAGPDTRDNIWILCTPCHKLVDFRRTYGNVHYNKALDRERNQIGGEP